MFKIFSCHRAYTLADYQNEKYLLCFCDRSPFVGNAEFTEHFGMNR